MIKYIFARVVYRHINRKLSAVKIILFIHKIFQISFQIKNGKKIIISYEIKKTAIYFNTPIYTNFIQQQYKMTQYILTKDINEKFIYLYYCFSGFPLHKVFIFYCLLYCDSRQSLTFQTVAHN